MPVAGSSLAGLAHPGESGKKRACAHEASANTIAIIVIAPATIAKILMLARRLPESMRVGVSGDWRNVPMGIDPRGKVLFIVGFGRIGQEVARRALAFKMKITWFDQRTPKTPLAETDYFSHASWHEQRGSEQANRPHALICH